MVEGERKKERILQYMHDVALV